MLRPHACRRAAAIFAGISLAAATGLAAQTGSTVRGRVLGPAGQGLGGALIIKTSPRVDTTVADTGGRYAVAHLGAGRYVFQIHASGYDPMEMELNLVGDTTLEVDVPLQPAAGAAAVGPKLAQVGFNQRRDQNRSRRALRFIGPEEIAAANATRITDLLRGIGEIELRPVNRYIGILGDGGRCPMPVFVEGQQATNFWPYTDHGLDEMVPLEQVAGIEVYPRDSQVPQEFVRPIAAAPSTYISIGARGSAAVQYDTHTVHCGVILIWTR